MESFGVICIFKHYVKRAPQKAKMPSHELSKTMKCSSKKSTLIEQSKVCFFNLFDLEQIYTA